MSLSQKYTILVFILDVLKGVKVVTAESAAEAAALVDPEKGLSLQVFPGEGKTFTLGWGLQEAPKDRPKIFRGPDPEPHPRTISKEMVRGASSEQITAWQVAHPDEVLC